MKGSNLMLLVLAGASLVIAHDAAAIAQNTSEATGYHEEITVVAPHVVRRQVLKRAIAKQAMPVELISVQQRVSYRDLDLSKKSDADILEKRINDAAVESCKELDRRFPPSVYMPTPADQDCVGTAANAALAVAREIISASSNR